MARPVNPSDDEFESADEGEPTSTTTTSHPTFLAQDSVSSSRLGSDEEESADLSEQQRGQRKKLRKKALESNARVSRPVERREDEREAEERNTYHLLDRLAAQSPTRVVRERHDVRFFTEYFGIL